MAVTLPFALLALSQALTLQEALSGVFGSISLATWIFLLVRIRPRIRLSTAEKSSRSLNWSLTTRLEVLRAYLSHS